MSIRTSLLKARFVSRPCLSCVVCRSLRRGAVGPPTASPRTRTHVPWVSCLDPRGVTESRMTLSQRSNLCVLVGVVTSCVLCACVRGRVSRSCATENTYTPPRLEALFKLSVVAILRHLYRSLQHLCGCTQNPSTWSTRSFLLSAVSQSTLFTYKKISFFLRRLINFECCRVCPWISLRRDTRCISCQRYCEHFQLSSECQASRGIGRSQRGRLCFRVKRR